MARPDLNKHVSVEEEEDIIVMAPLPQPLMFSNYPTISSSFSLFISVLQPMCSSVHSADPTAGILLIHPAEPALTRVTLSST